MVLLPCSKCCGPCWRCYRRQKECADYEPPSSVAFSLSPSSIALGSNFCQATADDEFPSPGPTAQCPTDSDYISLWNPVNENFSSNNFEKGYFSQEDYFYFRDILFGSECEQGRDDLSSGQTPYERCFPIGHQHRISFNCNEDTFSYSLVLYYGKGPNFPGLVFRSEYDKYNDGSGSFIMNLPPASESSFSAEFTAKYEDLFPFLEGMPISQDNSLAFNCRQVGSCSASYTDGVTEEGAGGASYRLIISSKTPFSVVCK